MNKQAMTGATLAVLLLGGTAAMAATTRIKQPLAATGADADASGEARAEIRPTRGVLRGKLEIRAQRLETEHAYEVTVDGVRIGAFTTNRAGKGKARFDSRPGRRDQLLGVDPRGKTIGIVDDRGATVLQAGVSDDSLDPADVRCCLPDDAAAECEDRTADECAALGGVDMGPGSCLPNPCAPATPPAGGDIVCCLPDDSGPECEDRTPDQCAAQGGVNVGAGVCTPDPCAPVAPADADVRCCLPDDSGPACEDRTPTECAALGGVNIGAGSCTPNPCLGGATTTTVPGATTTTTTTLPATPSVRVTCERRADRSRASVDGSGLAAGGYTARLSSNGSVATAPATTAVAGQAEFDFDSDPGDVAAGATAIAADFLGGSPVQATGEILDGGNNVVASATAACDVR